jgi:hypothetical protein
MSSDARDFNNIETQIFIKFFFPVQGKAPKEINAIVFETLREYTPSNTTVKDWVTLFNCGDFSTCVAPRPGRTKTFTTRRLFNKLTS